MCSSFRSAFLLAVSRAQTLADYARDAGRYKTRHNEERLVSAPAAAATGALDELKAPATGRYADMRAHASRTQRGQRQASDIPVARCDTHLLR